MTIWSRMRVGALSALGLMAVAVGGAGCSEEEGTACGRDQDCARGQICEDAVCAAVECQRIGDCPGSGRTCLFDQRTCSAKECAGALEGVELTCAGARSLCIETGGFASTCVDPSALSCSSAGDCAPLGGAFNCCQGVCSTDPTCGPIVDALPTPEDMSGRPEAGADMEVPGDMGTTADEGPPPTGGLCSPCRGDSDCASLGQGARCTAIGGSGSFCTSACGDGGAECPAGFQCVDGLDQCLPGIFECRGCLATPCGGGEVCDVFTGECRAPQGFCGTCADDDGCTAGLRCGPLGNFQRCFSPCEGGACATAGQTCQDGLCKPESGVCDAATGQCYYLDGTCNLGGGEAVCAPGSQCLPDFLLSLQFPDRGACSCVSSTPEIPFVAPDDIIGCHNRDTCIYFALPDQPLPPNGSCYSLF